MDASVTKPVETVDISVVKSNSAERAVDASVTKPVDTVDTSVVKSNSAERAVDASVLIVEFKVFCKFTMLPSIVFIEISKSPRCVSTPLSCVSK